jgi:hypothetical protein
MMIVITAPAANRFTAKAVRSKGSFERCFSKSILKPNHY